MDASPNIRNQFTLMSLILFIGCQGQVNKTETIENSGYGNPNLVPENAHSVDTSAGWSQNGKKLLLTGTIYYSDGKTPAPGVLIYYYHTNLEGKYQHKPSDKNSIPPNEKGQTHGYIRGWMKTDTAGRYELYTVRPGNYPTRDFPAHVHMTILEPNGIKEYYIDDIVFDDDHLLTTAKRRKMENRGGTGVVRLVKRENLMIGERNIYLGLNIPGHQGNRKKKIQSGKNIGEDVISFTPFHAWGPDKGTRTCPVCKYGRYHGILYFVGNKTEWPEIKQWLRFLEAESIKRRNYLKVYFIYGNDIAYDKKLRQSALEEIGNELGLKEVALTFVPAFSDTESEIHLNKVNQQVENTFLLYKRSTVFEKYINLKPGEENFALISRRLDESINPYFYLR